MVLDEGWTLGAPKALTGPSADPLGDKSGTTCGACRQHITEFVRNSHVVINSVAINGQREANSLDVLLPYGFSFNNFDPDIVEAKASEREEKTDFDFETMSDRVVRNETQTPEEIFDWLRSLESIDYASGLNQVVVLRLSSGIYVAGVKVENAAYVGTSAMQSALANAVTMYGVVDVAEIYTYGHRAGTAENLVYPIALSGLQGLNEFVKTDPKKIPVTMFTVSGDSITIGLGQAASLSTNFAHPAYRLSDGKLSVAA